MGSEPSLIDSPHQGTAYIASDRTPGAAITKITSTPRMAISPQINPSDSPRRAPFLETVCSGTLCSPETDRPQRELRLSKTACSVITRSKRALRGRQIEV